MRIKIPDSLNEVKHPELVLRGHVPALGQHEVGEEAEVLARRDASVEDYSKGESYLLLLSLAVKKVLMFCKKIRKLPKETAL